MLAAATREAAARGHTTTILLTDIARSREWLDRLDGARVRFLARPRSRLSLIAAAMRELDALAGARPGPAVLHAHFSTFDIPAALLRLRRPGLCVFWHEHGPLLDDRRTRLRNELRYIALGPLLSGVLCVSRELEQALRERHLPAAKLRYFPNAVDTGAFSPPSAAARAAARRALGLPEGARVLLHFAWDWERKGGPLMVAAARELATDRALVILTVLGERPGGIPVREVPSCVRSLAPTGEVGRLYAAADGFLSCGTAEGMPLAVLEALACGLPVVGSDLPVHRELLAGLPGGVVASGAAALAAAIKRVLALGERERAEHARLARERISAQFSLEGWARRLLDAYERAADRGA